MVEQSNDLRREIESHRDKLREDLADLESRVRESADWRNHYDKHPMWFVGAALGGGLLLSGMVSRRSPAGNRHPPANKPAEHNGGRGGVFSQVFAEAKTAMVTFGMAKAKEALADALPAYREHLRQTKPL